MAPVDRLVEAQIRIGRTLEWLDLELRHGVRALPEEHVIFGSTVLFLHGYREVVGDIDVFVSRRVWELWKAKPGWDVQTPREGDPSFLTSWTRPYVSAFHAWTQRDEWIDVGECFARAEVVKGWRCIPLELVRDHKRASFASQPDPDAATHAKHLEDLRVLDYVLS